MEDERRRRFDRLRDADSAWLAGYAEFAERSAARTANARALLRLRFALPATAVLILALGWGFRGANLPLEAEQPAFVPGAWAMPTDILLDTPGSELLGAPPRIGSPIDLSPSAQLPWRNSG